MYLNIDKNKILLIILFLSITIIMSSKAAASALRRNEEQKQRARLAQQQREQRQNQSRLQQSPTQQQPQQQQPQQQPTQQNNGPLQYANPTQMLLAHNQIIHNLQTVVTNLDETMNNQGVFLQEKFNENTVDDSNINFYKKEIANIKSQVSEMKKLIVSMQSFTIETNVQMIELKKKVLDLSLGNNNSENKVNTTYSPDDILSDTSSPSPVDDDNTNVIFTDDGIEIDSKFMENAKALLEEDE